LFGPFSFRMLFTRIPFYISIKTIAWLELEFPLITLRLPRSRVSAGCFFKRAHFLVGMRFTNCSAIDSVHAFDDSSNIWCESEILLITLRRFVDASRDKPERRSLSVFSLRLPRSRVFAGWSMRESAFRSLLLERRLTKVSL